MTRVVVAPLYRVVHAYVQDAIAKGATALVGGDRPDSPGWFCPPAVLTGITADI